MSNCLKTITEDSVCLSNVNKTTSSDNFINTTIIECLTDNSCPLDEVLSELLITLVSKKNLSLDSSRGILLLDGDRETLKERFVQYVSTNEPTIVRSFTLSVSSSDNSKSFSRFYILADLLKENTFTFKNRL